MIYLFLRRHDQIRRNYPDDLSARKAAERSYDVGRVETLHGRVVWRRVETALPAGMTSLEGDLSDWFNRKK